MYRSASHHVWLTAYILTIAVSMIRRNDSSWIRTHNTHLQNLWILEACLYLSKDTKEYIHRQYSYAIQKDILQHMNKDFCDLICRKGIFPVSVQCSEQSGIYMYMYHKNSYVQYKCNYPLVSSQVSIIDMYWYTHV